MESIGIRELRQYASRYVALAASGQRVAVTDRGVLVAYLVPADPSAPLDRLAAAGQYEPAVGSILDLLPPPAAPVGARPLSAVVGQLRDEERW
ncbi:type II toxin-antitoxin system prevent-host-death family antitoxin [Frankia sp. Cr1]|uniref:type II toxin-antitoxin system Phd/YefM family antitoxin n=1 Tax=Frankia sp. Cr1 TaxID=3073931 RepID=UPI002AD21A04|nr:type II toxin-antitoxin system prevent-host-death family antitoxin [Frankia sp. Cr1]